MQHKAKRPKEVCRSTEQYQEGRNAYEYGQDLDDLDVACPYPEGSGKRTGWMTGWLDMWVLIRHGHTFRKYGVKYP